MEPRYSVGGYSVANIFLIIYFTIVAVTSFGILAIPAIVTAIVASVIAVALIAHL